MNNNKRDWMFEYKCIFYLARKDFVKIDFLLNNKLKHDYSFYYITALKYYYKKMLFDSLKYFKILLTDFKVRKSEINWIYKNIIVCLENDIQYVEVICEIKQIIIDNY